MPWDVVPALEPAMTGQQLAQRLAKAGWNAIVDYGVGTAGNTPQPDLIREFYDGMSVSPQRSTCSLNLHFWLCG